MTNEEMQEKLYEASNYADAISTAASTQLAAGGSCHGISDMPKA